MTPEVRIDATRALAKFSPAGIPEMVRNNLRRVLPDLTKALGARVESKLSSELKSRTNLQVKKEIVENDKQIIGRVETVWTGDAKSSMVPQVLESGARPHVIAAVNASALSFFWPVIGGQAFFKQVMHPGFPGIQYTERSFNEMKSEIISTLTAAVKAGAQEA